MVFVFYSPFSMYDCSKQGFGSNFIFPSFKQLAFDDDVSAVQTNGGCLLLHISRLQMVSNGGNLYSFQHIRIHSLNRRLPTTQYHSQILMSNLDIDPIDLQIPLSTEGKEWYYYVDKNVTIDLLERLTDEFLAIWNRSPAKLKHKLSSTIKDLTTSARSVRIIPSNHQMWF